jgi:hypothetical protein
MDESADPTKPEPDPPTQEAAQLLRLLEIQSAARRQKHTVAASPFQGDSFRYGSLVVIVVLGLGSVGLMEWFLSQLPRPAQRAAAAPAASATPAATFAKSGSAIVNSTGNPRPGD